MRFFKVGIVAVVVAAIVLLIVLFRPTRREAAFFPMGGIPFKVVAYDRTMLQFDTDMAEVRKRVAELESVFDRFNAGSELSKINKIAAVAPVTVSQDIEQLVELSRKWNKESDGAFDPTVVPLEDLWKQAAESGKLPEEGAVRAARAKTGLDKVSQAGNLRIFFAREGMGLDFGAIAKGLIADSVAKVLTSRGVARGVVDAGGNALAFGEGSFLFGIQDPTAAKRGVLIGTVDVRAGAVITSGNYERYVEIGGKRYSHIIDPHTGRPVDNGLLSATVIGGNGADADALATALMVLGREKGIALIKRLENVKAVLIEETPHGPEVWASASLGQNLKLDGEWSKRLHQF